MTNITFEQFQQTRKWVDDVNDAVGMASDEPCSGFVYRDNLHIFGMGGGAAPDQYLLVIGNIQKVSDDLTDLERDLYEYGVTEGMLEAE